LTASKESFVKRPGTLLSLKLVCILAATHVYADTTIIRADRMIDIATGELISPALIVVDDNRISAVNPASPPDVDR